jgi:hypothetical protein
MMPGFSAEQSLRRSDGRYRGRRASGGSAAGPAIDPQAGGVSGLYFGTFCFPGGVLTVVTIDIDENGQLLTWHAVDEIGSCEVPA